MAVPHPHEPLSSNEALRRLLTHRPSVAWPTVALFVGFVGVFSGSAALASSGLLPAVVAVGLSTIASYISYSVLHEAAHGLVSTNKLLNDWAGRISLLGVSITPYFLTYRFIHLAHHRFTNDPIKDADHFSGRGPAWTLPLRWMVMDVAYVATYFRSGFYKDRPLSEKLDFWLASAFGLAVVATVVAMGWVGPFLLLYVLPTRLGLLVLAFAFDYLPHYPHRVTAREDMFRATSNRVGLEWLLTPLLVGQNYHLSHHLYPTAPFYRYRAVWNARQAYHDAQNAATVPPFGLRPQEQKTARRSVLAAPTQLT